MRRLIAATLAVGFLLLGKSAAAHRIDEYLQATLVSLEATRVQASMRLIPGTLVAPTVIASINRDGDGVFSDDEERAYAQRVLADLAITIDGRPVRPKLLSWSFPRAAQMHAGLGEIRIAYSADLPPGSPSRILTVANHHLSHMSVYLVNALVPENSTIQIVAQQRNEQQSFYELDYRQASAATTVARRSWTEIHTWLDDLQFTTLFRLGMRHIAEGTGHLLFLLTLLLPAPLLAAGSRWGPAATGRQSLRRVVAIVTAFTIGHSITLTLAALGILQVPSRPIEVLIAVSILVSALHALRPVVPGKESYIAGCFGLIHGLAFAATLDRLGLGHWQRIVGVLAFNLGIETMQMGVVAAILPSLLLLSRTRAYILLRNGGAVFAGLASLGWVVERLFNVDVPIDSIVNALAHHALWIAGALFLTSLVCNSLANRQLATSPAISSGSPARLSGVRGLIASM